MSGDCAVRARNISMQPLQAFEAFFGGDPTRLRVSDRRRELRWESPQDPPGLLHLLFRRDNFCRPFLGFGIVRRPALTVFQTAIRTRVRAATVLVRSLLWRDPDQIAQEQTRGNVGHCSAENESVNVRHSCLLNVFTP